MKTHEWDELTYSKALTEYNIEIRKAKRSSWRKLCEQIKSLSQGARLHKLLSKAECSLSHQIGILKREDGSFTSFEKETLELMPKTHFPGATGTKLAKTNPPYKPRNKD